MIHCIAFFVCFLYFSCSFLFLLFLLFLYFLFSFFFFLFFSFIFYLFLTFGANKGKKKFTNLSVYNAHLNGKKHKRAMSQRYFFSFLSFNFWFPTFPQKNLNFPFFFSFPFSSAPDKTIAILEFKIFRIGFSLQRVIERTVRNIEAKQAKNWEEIQVFFFFVLYSETSLNLFFPRPIWTKSPKKKSLLRKKMTKTKLCRALGFFLFLSFLPFFPFLIVFLGLPCWVGREAHSLLAL